MQKSQKNLSIEYLRAAAVLLVFCHHLYSIAGIETPYFSLIGGWLGVQIFFVVSGYLIALSAIRYSVFTYVKHRFLRIYPAYFFWFIVFSFAFGYLRFDNLSIKSLALHLVFLQHFFPASYEKYNALSVSWTLTVEVVWYVLIFVLINKFQKKPIQITLIFVFLACFWVFGGNALHPLVGKISPEEGNFFINNIVIAQLPFFFFGALVAKYDPKYDKAGLMAIFLSTIVFFDAWKSYFPHPIFLTGFGATSLFLILKNSNLRRSKIISLLSDISYSFYLIHYPIISILSKYSNNKIQLSAIALLGTILISYLSYKFIELPFIKIARGARPVE